MTTPSVVKSFLFNIKFCRNKTVCMMTTVNEIKASLRRSMYKGDILWTLENLYSEINDADETNLLEYIPVKIVSCMEEYFRQWYKEIIDNPKYRKNLKKVKSLKDFRYDFETIDSFQNNELTLGDYLSYSFPCSSVDSIINHLNTLLDVDFKKWLFSDSCVIEDNAFGTVHCIKVSKGSLLDSTAEIFRIRHILCHEGGLDKKMEKESYLKMLSQAMVFIKVSDDFLSDLLYPRMLAMTQADMDSYAIKQFEQAEAKLHKAIAYLKSHDEQKMYDFAYIESWKEFREKKAECDSKFCDGGTMHPTFYYMSLEETTSSLVDQLLLKCKYNGWDSIEDDAMTDPNEC